MLLWKMLKGCLGIKPKYGYWQVTVDSAMFYPCSRVVYSTHRYYWHAAMSLWFSEHLWTELRRPRIERVDTESLIKKLDM